MAVIAAYTVPGFAKCDDAPAAMVECAVLAVTPASCESESDYAIFVRHSRTSFCSQCASSDWDLSLPPPTASCPSTRWLAVVELFS